MLANQKQERFYCRMNTNRRTPEQPRDNSRSVNHDPVYNMVFKYLSYKHYKGLTTLDKFFGLTWFFYLFFFLVLGPFLVYEWAKRTHNAQKRASKRKKYE